MGGANTLTNLSTSFDEKAEQAKLFQAIGDKATVRTLWKELLELSLQSTRIRTSEEATSHIRDKINVLASKILELNYQTNGCLAQLDSLQDKLTKVMGPTKYIQPYVEDEIQGEQNTTRQSERQKSGQRGENDAELKALGESDEGDKGFKCEMSGALGDLNISDSTTSHNIPGLPTSDDLDRLVYDAGDRREPKPYKRVTGYGCASYDPNTFGKLVDHANVGPSWLGLDGYEKSTSQWLEFFENELRKIATTEKEDMGEREPQRIHSEGALSTSPDPCACGDTCSVIEKAEAQKRWYAEDSPIEEDAEHREEQFQKEHEFLTSTARASLKELEDDAKVDIEISLRDVDCLKDILALAKGKSQDSDPFEPECSLGSDEDLSNSFTSLETYHRLETYCRYIRRHQHLEIDPQILDLTKKLLTLADEQEIALRAALIEESIDYEERVRNGEEVKANMLVYLRKLLRFAGDKNVEDDADIAGEGSESEEGDIDDPTESLTISLKLYLDRLNYMISDGSQIEVYAELLAVARRVVEYAASTEPQNPKVQQPNRPPVVIQYELTSSGGHNLKSEQLLDHVVENGDGTFTCSAEERVGRVNSSITCREDVLNNSQNWHNVALEESKKKQPQKPWFVITHAVKAEDGDILSNTQPLGFECISNNCLASLGGSFRFPRSVIVSNTVYVERDGRIICRAKSLFSSGFGERGNEQHHGEH